VRLKFPSLENATTPDLLSHNQIEADRPFAQWFCSTQLGRIKKDAAVLRISLTSRPQHRKIRHIEFD
jgi:hypothetical protein